MKTFANYKEAQKYAKKHKLPLWDTRQMPDRYVVGHLSAKVEADPDNADWVQLQ